MGKWQDYNEYFEKAATTYNVDKRLLIAVAKTESDFNPKATSGAGAKGIKQRQRRGAGKAPRPFAFFTGNKKAPLLETVFL